MWKENTVSSTIGGMNRWEGVTKETTEYIDEGRLSNFNIWKCLYDQNLEFSIFWLEPKWVNEGKYSRAMFMMGDGGILTVAKVLSVWMLQAYHVLKNYLDHNRVGRIQAWSGDISRREGILGVICGLQLHVWQWPLWGNFCSNEARLFWEEITHIQTSRPSVNSWFSVFGSLSFPTLIIRKNIALLDLHYVLRRRRPRLLLQGLSNFLAGKLIVKRSFGDDSAQAKAQESTHWSNSETAA